MIISVIRSIKVDRFSIFICCNLPKKTCFFSIFPWNLLDYNFTSIWLKSSLSIFSPSCLLLPLLFLNFRATQLVLKAHKEAVNSLSGNGSAKLGTVATVVAAANSTAAEASKEIEAAMQIAMRNALGAMLNRVPDGPMDDLSIMKVSIMLILFVSSILASKVIFGY